MTKSDAKGGEQELVGFEKDKFEAIRACPNCPGMLKEEGQSCDDEKIQHDWRCYDCGAVVSKVYREAATRWFVSRRSDAPARPSVNLDARPLHGFEREKFEMARACPVCPGMLQERTETHGPTSVVYSWQCSKCGGSVTQRFNEQRTLWEPAKPVAA